MSIRDKLLAFIREEEGLTTVEYAVAGGLVSAAVIAAFTALGVNINTIITGITAALPG
jgi:pilus assembly protein Flp/PilA